MFVGLEEKDLDAIEQRLAKSLKSLLQSIERPHETSLLDVKGLADYLRVPKTWIYDQTKRGEIPHMKLKKYLRFKKADIDRWLESKNIRRVFSRR